MWLISVRSSLCFGDWKVSFGDWFPWQCMSSSYTALVPILFLSLNNPLGLLVLPSVSPIQKSSGWQLFFGDIVLVTLRPKRGSWELMHVLYLHPWRRLLLVLVTIFLLTSCTGTRLSLGKILAQPCAQVTSTSPSEAHFVVTNLGGQAVELMAALQRLIGDHNPYKGFFFVGWRMLSTKNCGVSEVGHLLPPDLDPGGQAKATSPTESAAYRWQPTSGTRRK